MNKRKKIEKIIESALTDDLAEYAVLLKKIKKRLPFIGGTKRLAAALLKEQFGDISGLDFEVDDILRTQAPGSTVFEDIKDGRARLFINIGKNHNISPGDLIREIVKHSGIDGKSVGKIDIHSTYSFMEIPEQFAELVLVSLDKTKIRGVNIVVEPAKKRKKSE